jgi:TolA-binding protein
MRYQKFIFLLVLLVGLAATTVTAQAEVLETRYATVSYGDDEVLRLFDKRVKLGGMGFSFGSKVNTNLRSEVRKKINQINGRVQEILEMRPQDMRLKVVLLPNKKEVQQIYWDQYQRKVDFIAFYSPLTKTAYFSVDNLSLRVYAHEIAHATINHYFAKDPPVKIHEMLAQYVETQI